MSIHCTNGALKNVSSPQANPFLQSSSHDSAIPVGPAVMLYENLECSFWKFKLEVPVQPFEAKWTYVIENARFLEETRPRDRARGEFYVPAEDQSMRMMFHSCNGFSVGTDEEAWSGPALWNDVLRMHVQKPFHVMIGGGDQIYNDGVRVSGPLNAWTSIGNPIKRRWYPFDRDLRDRCDKFYLDNYVRWYSMEPFATANSQIPQINIWDDHDIIDGFGSYTDDFMKCNVFLGIGGVAFKYYLLFQHHIAPPAKSFTSEEVDSDNEEHADATERELEMLKTKANIEGIEEEPGWILGKRPGPYIPEVSRSLYYQLGARVAFVGIDARTERTRHQVNYDDTYKLIFDRVNLELSNRRGEIKHLIVLLGIPIAYPRLIWLENILTSPIIGPIRFLNRRFGFAGGLFNRFDGQVDLLDDLDDHYTARQHKGERRGLIQMLQEISKLNNVRVTILGGDVHLGAVGRFYSKPKLNIPTERDHRYMANIISSAITNKPPPQAVANLVARRNKIHHLDHDTDETLLNLFDRDPGNSTKTAAKNHCTMPSRNYAILTESGSDNGRANGNAVNGQARPVGGVATGKDGHSSLHPGEEGAGTNHGAASGFDTGGMFAAHGLDVSLRVEIDPSNREGLTDGYGLSSTSLLDGSRLQSLSHVANISI